jgi:hypothetical protein
MEINNSLESLGKLSEDFSKSAYGIIDSNASKGSYFKTLKYKFELSSLLFKMKHSSRRSEPGFFDEKSIEFAEVFAKWANNTKSTDEIIRIMPKNMMNADSANDLRKLKAPNFADIVEQAYK